MILCPTPDRGGIQLAREGRQQQQYGDAVGVHAGCTRPSSYMYQLLLNTIYCECLPGLDPLLGSSPGSNYVLCICQVVPL